MPLQRAGHIVVIRPIGFQAGENGTDLGIAIVLSLTLSFIVPISEIEHFNNAWWNGMFRISRHRGRISMFHPLPNVTPAFLEKAAQLAEEELLVWIGEMHQNGTLHKSLRITVGPCNVRGSRELQRFLG